MKILITLLTVTSILLSGCSSLQNPTVSAVATVTEQVLLPLLIQKLPASEQVTVKKYASGLATAVRTIDPATPPTVAQFDALLVQWMPTQDPAYKSLALILSTVYVDQVLPKLGKNTKLNSANLEAFASVLDSLAR